MKILTDEDYARIIAALTRAERYVTGNGGGSAERDEVLGQLRAAKLHDLCFITVTGAGGSASSDGGNPGCASGGVSQHGWNPNATVGLGSFDGRGNTQSGCSRNGGVCGCGVGYCNGKRIGY